MFDFTTSPVETKPDVFTLEALYPWLRSFPPKWEYPYSSAHSCACGLYLKAAGEEICGKARNEFEFGSESRRKVFADKPHTFGAAADRCRAAMEKVPA